MKRKLLVPILPPLYAAWIEVILAEPLPHESQSDCNNCPMCTESNSPTKMDVLFRPSIKCCTYIPKLPNFSIGRILNDTDPAIQTGKSTIRSRIHSRTSVTPLGIGRSKEQSVAYVALTKGKEFGSNEEYSCPHQLRDQKGLCGIWEHRNSTCATWFCKHDRGQIGRDFWDSLQTLLADVERILSCWCAIELDIGDDALLLLCPVTKKKDGEKIENRVDKLALTPVPEAIYKQAWGSFIGREEDFYIECGKLVNDLSWSDILDISGPELKIAVRRLISAQQVLKSKELPEYVELGGYTAVNPTPNTIRIIGYSPYCPYDFPIEISTGLMMMGLGMKGPQKLQDVIARIQGMSPIKIDTELQWGLIECGVLIPTRDVPSKQDEYEN